MRNSDSENSNSRHGGRDSRGRSTDGYHGRNKQPRFSNNDGHNYRHRHEDEDFTTKRRSRFHDDDLTNNSQHRDDRDFEDREQSNDRHKTYDETVREEFYRPSRFGGRFSHGHREDENYDPENRDRHYSRSEAARNQEFETRDREQHNRRNQRKNRNENQYSNDRLNRDENRGDNQSSRYGGRDFGSKEGRGQRGTSGENRKLTHSRQPAQVKRNTTGTRRAEKKQGFASMSREEVQRIASMGGKAHAKNGSSNRSSKNGSSGRNGSSRSRK